MEVRVDSNTISNRSVKSNTHEARTVAYITRNTSLVTQAGTAGTLKRKCMTGEHPTAARTGKKKCEQQYVVCSNVVCCTTNSVVCSTFVQLGFRHVHDFGESLK